MDKELSNLLGSLQKRYFSEKKKYVDTERIFWTPVELVVTSFPESRIESDRWVRAHGKISLNMSQLEPERSVPYGILAREMFEYFFNEYVTNLNNGVQEPSVFSFSSASELFNKVKGNCSGTRVSQDQRILILEMLLNFESCAIRFTKCLSENSVVSRNDLFFRSYKGPKHDKVKGMPSSTTSGEILIQLDDITFYKFSESTRVPTKSFIAKLAGANVMARDLSIVIARLCYSLVKRNTDYQVLGNTELRMYLGKPNECTVKKFNKDLKRAVELLKKNYETAFPFDEYPASLISPKRGELQLLVTKPSQPDNILACG
ncbi:hypothetical protein [Halobacteriovorax sp. CON-3]|uniref:hypothetical protein n=1 Tax=Halobacteriovorax sp. CON-3 TaxID=3157710 RepID=UPI00371D765E